jgi:mannose-6-phosphate isomerase-like protein (cupin superfamily)
MTYPRDTGEVSARFQQAGEVERISRTSGTVTRFVAPGSLTNGQFGLFEWIMPANAGGASPHFHKTFSESFYITSGTVQLYDGREWADAAAGDFLYVPQGGVHAFRNAAGEPASMLILFAPGAPREKYFREVAEIANTGRQLSYDEWTELYARHDQYRAE